MSFSALILAGGRSSRMGTDKALLVFEGETLVARQVRRAREAGAAEVLLSGRAGVDYGLTDTPVLLDEVSDQGPLAGVARGLMSAHLPLLLVLAVDMPHVPDAWLGRGPDLTGEIGLVARLPSGLEPLAAWYPRAAAKLAEARLKDGSGSVRAFAEACAEIGLMRVVDLGEGCARGFTSWNMPADLPRY